MLKRFRLEDMIPVICETINSGKRFKLYPRGTSMLPMIVEDKTAVSLVKTDNPQKGDVLLYRRQNGQYVLHRCIKICGDEYVMCGDNQFVLEHGITRDMIIAGIDGYYPGDKFVSVEDKEYKKYVKCLPMRRKYKKIKNLILLVKNKIWRTQKSDFNEK